MITIRDAVVADAHGVAVVHVDSWRAAYAGLIDQAVLDRQSVESRATMWSTWIERSLAGESTDGYGSVAHHLVVAETDDRIVGWATFGAGRDDDSGGLGEIAGLYAHPDAWSQGVGRALISHAEDALLTGGWIRAYLWVLAGNERAIGFYGAHGWSPDGVEKIGEGGSVEGLREQRLVKDLTSSAERASAE
ncbi:GNAT family N-acetyltransferase [Microbacterium sp. 1.5R]|uniref:GNAT family N-acetyltransferase n=1 Tax=Microbacterium sp. 1.5R TaxID=1916917 RepID=UPI0021B1C6FE|nr:GNAT family N-acetyltransferase [Microbacterium sp. 1.5R]